MKSAILALLVAAPLLGQATKVQPAAAYPEPVVGQWQLMQKQPFDDSYLARLKVPEGFSVNVVANHLIHPRMILPIGNGWVLVSRPKLNDVIALHERDGDGRADELRTVVQSIPNAHGLAIRGNRLFVCGEKKLVAIDIDRAGPTFSAPRVLIDDLPDGGQHRYRTIGIGPDDMLYVSVGSDCNDCAESNAEHATMLRVDPETGERQVFARGLRNTIGFDWRPGSDELWGLDISVDWRGNDLPPEEVNRIVENGDYGWPYCWGKKALDESRENPEGDTVANQCKASKGAELLIPAHSSPIGFTFYRKGQFPASYRGDGFAAYRGSWNREPAREPKIVRIHWANGKPQSTDDFVSGFQLAGGKKQFGRLAGVAVDGDGSLLFSDDDNGVLYRVSWHHPAAKGEPVEPVTQPVSSRVAHVDGMESPESILPDGDVYLVSNIHGHPEVKDGNGYISRVRPDGTVAVRKWIAGGMNGVTLHAPKGMAVRGDELWVADIDTVRVFHRQSGVVLRSVAVPGALFLNDVAVGGDGNVYATDSGWVFDAEHNRKHPGPDRIFRITPEGTVSVAIESPSLKAPNGLMWDPSRAAFLVVQSGGTDVVSWAPGDAAVKSVATGKGAWDGIVLMANGECLLSSQHDNVIYRMKKDGRLEPLFARPPAPADIGYDPQRNRLLVPSLQGNWVEIWQLAP